MGVGKINAFMLLYFPILFHSHTSSINNKAALQRLCCFLNGPGKYLTASQLYPLYANRAGVETASNVDTNSFAAQAQAD
jgi:hypothetical protein